MTESAEVLVVGGGLVGLSAAMFLARHGVPTVLVERHAGSSAHPRAIGYTPRTMELLREVELGGRIPEAPSDFRLIRARVDSLDGEWHERSTWTPEDEADDGVSVEFSPCRGAAIAQDLIEPILRERAIALGADVRLATEMVNFVQDGAGVTVTLQPDGGEQYTVRARYLVAADGARSPIRTALGITQSGRGHIRAVRSVLFRAPLEQYLESGVTQFEIDQPDLKAFLTTYNDGRWVLMFTDDIDRDHAALSAAIQAAIGRDDVPVDIITTGRWDWGALVADRFNAGRIFLAGDAAHALPPTRGGYGANTGIQDAHNLAWKLASVTSGAADPTLLDTYDAERRPVAWRRHQQIFARPDYQRDAQGWVADAVVIDDDAMEFGQLYRSTSVIGAGPELPPAQRPDKWNGQPGTRAPHTWITQGDNRISTLDLFGKGWVLVCADTRWCDAATAIPPIRAVVVTDPSVLDAFGIERDGASLVRPDGYIGWRSTTFTAACQLKRAFAQIAATPAAHHNLEHRLRHLEDIHAIKDLTARYALAINKGWNGKTAVDVDGVADIFTTDGTWDNKTMGVRADGLDDLLTKLVRETAGTDFSMHSYTNPVLRIDGERATGNWLFWIASRRDGGATDEVFMSQDIVYRNTTAGWRIQNVDVHFGTTLRTP